MSVKRLTIKSDTKAEDIRDEFKKIGTKDLLELDAAGRIGYSEDAQSAFTHILKIEIAKPEYAGMKDEEIINAINIGREEIKTIEETYPPKIVDLFKVVLARVQNPLQGFSVSSKGDLLLSGTKLETELNKAIDREMAENPKYSGKTKSECITAMLSSTVESREVKASKRSVLNEIMDGIPYTPNQITQEDLTLARL